MGKEIVLFNSVERTDLQSVSAFLHQLADTLTQNQVIFRQGQEEITVTIPDNVVLELKVETEVKMGKTERCLEVEIEWIEGDQSGGLVTVG